MKAKEKTNRRRNIRELRKAKAELSMLSSYLFECEEALKDYALEWNQDINFILAELSDFREEVKNLESQTSFVNESNFHQESFEEDKREDPKIKSNAPDWVKKAFRKIALKTHPDKLKGKENSEEMQDLYSKANAAVSEENYDLLLEICNKLEIQNEIDPELELQYNLKRQDSIKGDLKKITESLPWLWCEAYDNVSIRKKILVSVLPHYGVKLENQESLDLILEKIKAE